jgi:diacylglycerol kinase family enzyme
MDPARSLGLARWLARLSIALALSAVVVVGVETGLKAVAMLAVGLAGAAVSLVAAFWFLSRRGVLRWLSLAAFTVAPLAVIAVYALHSLLWVALVAAALWLAAAATARAALAYDPAGQRMPEYPVPRPARYPFLIMNPKSGGGKVGRFELRRKAEALGAEVLLLDGPEMVDVAEEARRAIARGADLLGVAGGDGTQALVAGVAAEHGLPFVVISAGTRNHFALDLGLDISDPAACLDALRDAVELRVDLGAVNGRTFVNNVSFGAYAEIVEDPAYRSGKLRTSLELLPDLLRDRPAAGFTGYADGTELGAPQALLVANNPYGTGGIAGMNRRARLDRGELGVLAVRVGNALQAADLLRGRRATGLRVLSAHEVTVTASMERLPVGIDGEAVSLQVPVRCTISPRALRVWVPRDRPGDRPAGPELAGARLWALAGVGREPRPSATGQADRVPRRELA